MNQGEGMVTLGVRTGLVSSDPVLIEQGGVYVTPQGAGQEYSDSEPYPNKQPKSVVVAAKNGISA